MKTTVSYWMAPGWLVLGRRGGQDERGKLRHDPTYSTHYYKHANKAATARKWRAAR